MLYALCHKQNLRTLIKQLGSLNDPNVKSVVDEYIRSFESGHRGTLKGELMAYHDGDSSDQIVWGDIDKARGADHEVLEDSTASMVRGWLSDRGSLYVQNVNPYVLPLTKYQDRGFCYRASHISDGDSHIAFVRSGGKRWRAGCIVKIFRYYRYERDGHPRFTQVFFLVQEYARLTQEHAEHDPYRKFPIAGGQLFYNILRPRLRLLTVDNITCHCAIIPRLLPCINIECIHVLPLDKVSMVIANVCNAVTDQDVLPAQW